MDDLFFLIKRAYLAANKAADEELARRQLTMSQLEVLLHLWQQDGLEQRHLQEYLGISSSTLTGIIDVLVDHGRVERRVSAEDARVKQLFLTQTGRALLAEAQAVRQRVNARLLQGFSASEAALLSDWLRRIMGNMGDHEDTPF